MLICIFALSSCDNGTSDISGNDEDVTSLVDDFFNNEDDNDDDDQDSSDEVEVYIPIRGNAEIDRTNDFVVATVNGVDIWAQDVEFELNRAKTHLAWEYFPPNLDKLDPSLAPSIDFNEIDFDEEVQPGVSFARLVREEAVRLTAELVLILDYARQIGVELTEDDMAIIEMQITTLLEQNGADMFYFMLEQEGLRDMEHLIQVLGIHATLDHLVNLLMTNPVEFLPFEEFMPEVIECDADARIAALMEMVLAGEDFSTLIMMYGEDPGMQSYPNGYTFIVGDMVEPFEAAVLDLEIGEISGIVRTDFGYHIIMRVEPDPDNVMTGSRFLWGGEDEELLGAKHILVLRNDEHSLEDRQLEAILLGFDAMNKNSEIIFLPELDNIFVGP